MWEKIWDNSGNVIAIIGLLWAVYTHFYYNKIKFYLWINRMIKRRKEVFFNINFTYKIRKNYYFYKELENIFKNIYSSPVKKESNLTNNKIYRLKDFFMKVQIDSEINSTDEFNEVFIEFPMIRTSLSNSKNIIEAIEKIDEVIRDGRLVEKSNYCFEVVFQSFKDNPFSYTIVKHFGEEYIKNFSCTIDSKILDSKKSGENIKITKEKMIINRENFSEIRKLIPYLLLIEGDN